MSSTTSQTSWFITGTSRGIGLELVRQLVQFPSNLVVAACRRPGKATALADLTKTAKGTLHIIKIDVNDFDDVRTLPKQLDPILGEIGLDYLVNNAATTVWDSAFTLDPETLLDILRTNTAAPALVSQVVLPFLEKGRTKKIVHVSSYGGSIASVSSDRMQEKYRKVTSYSMSKTTLNMLAYKQKVERPDLIVIAMCPGWVKTDMGGMDAALEPEESVSGVIKLITSVTSADSGKFLSYNGDEIPW